MEEKKPNIVIFCADQWRADCTGIDGHPIIKTPGFDALAKDGTYFANAYTANPICTPTRCSLCTGNYPHTQSHRAQDYLVGETEPHLFQYLKDAGYEVVWSGKNDMLTTEAIQKSVDIRLPNKPNEFPTRHPKRKSWDEYHRDIPMDDPTYYSQYMGLDTDDIKSHMESHALRGVLDYIRQPHEKPFCLWINTAYPHPPYYAPEPYFSMYSRDVDAAIPHTEEPGEPEFKKAARKFFRSDEYSQEHQNEMRAVYYGMISLVDDVLAAVMEELKIQNLYDNSAVFALSDHGNYTFDYGQCEKWFIGVDDAITRVPFALKMPYERNKGAKSEALIQSLDLFATCMEIANVKAAVPHCSKSLLPLTQEPNQEFRDAVFTDCGANLTYEYQLDIERYKARDFRPSCCLFYNPQLLRNPHCSQRTLMMRTHKWKFVWRQIDPEELYDMENDPYELKNLLASPHSSEIDAVRNQMLLEMFRWFVETGDILGQKIYFPPKP